MTALEYIEKELKNGNNNPSKYYNYLINVLGSHDKVKELWNALLVVKQAGDAGCFNYEHTSGQLYDFADKAHDGFYDFESTLLQD